MATSHGFHDVDRSSDPASFALYLDSVSGLESVQSYKRRILSSLALTPGLAVLDVGCGTGDDVAAMSELIGTSGRAVGIDSSATLIEEARRRALARGNKVELEVGDAHALPFPDASFDVVRAERTFQHLVDPVRALAEMVRVTKQGGRIAVAEPDWETLAVDVPLALRPALRVVLNHRCDQARNGWVGRSLAALFREQSLDRVTVSAETLMIHDRAIADFIFELSGSVEQSKKAGAIDGAQATALLAAFDSAAATNRFFSAATGFVAVGLRR